MRTTPPAEIVKSFTKTFNSCKVNEEIEIQMSTHADNNLVQTFVLGAGTSRGPLMAPDNFYVYRKDTTFSGSVQYASMGEFYLMADGEVHALVTDPAVFSAKDCNRMVETLLVATGRAYI